MHIVSMVEGKQKRRISSAGSGFSRSFRQERFLEHRRSARWRLSMNLRVCAEDSTEAQPDTLISPVIWISVLRSGQ